MRALERTLIFNNKNNYVILKNYNNKVHLSSQSAIGKINEELLCESTGEIEIEIAFNAKYILEVLNAIDEEEVIFKFIDNKDPIIIETDDFFNMTLPIVIKENISNVA
jgi:DNA polymerase III beta subunit, C-terminal domain.